MKNNSTNFHHLIIKKLGGEYDPEKMGGDRPELYQDTATHDRIREINEAISAATAPRADITSRVRGEVEEALSIDTKAQLAQNPNRDGVLRGLTNERLKENYSNFVHYLRKIERYIEEQKERMDSWVGNPSDKFIKDTNYESLTLKDWIQYVEVFQANHSVFRDRFGWQGIRKIIGGLQIKDLESFLNRTIAGHIKDADEAGFKL